jgi:DUF971 family protein
LEIIDEGDAGLSITWSDGAETNYTGAFLRRRCACAGCVNEWTGERTLKPDTIADDVTIKTISVVGRYALSFDFSDGHNTGIFSFQYLKEIAK